MADLSSVSSADLAAALQARELAAVNPLKDAYQALLTAAQSAQTAMAGIANTRASALVTNTLANTQGYLNEVDAVIQMLTPPAPVEASPKSDAA